MMGIINSIFQWMLDLGKCECGRCEQLWNAPHYTDEMGSFRSPYCWDCEEFDNIGDCYKIRFLKDDGHLTAEEYIEIRDKELKKERERTEKAGKEERKKALKLLKKYRGKGK